MNSSISLLKEPNYGSTDYLTQLRGLHSQLPLLKTLITEALTTGLFLLTIKIGFLATNVIKVD